MGTVHGGLSPSVPSAMGYDVQPMVAWIKSALIILAMGVVGFFGSFEADYLVSPRGEIGPTVLQAQSPISAIFAVVLTIGVASIIGGFVPTK